MACAKMLLALLVVPLLQAQAALLADKSRAHANPIRKVVQMLQAMSKKVTEEGAAEAELFEKFMCYCKTGTSDLTKSIDAAETKIPQIAADLKAAEADLAETKEGLKQDQADRAAAKEAIAEATGIRNKENAAFVAVKDELTANIAALLKAVKALEKGMAGSFLQTGAADRARRVVAQAKDLLEEDRQQVLSFLSGNPFSQGYAPSSGQIVGILKQLGDSMATTLATETAAEEKAVHVYSELMKAKTAEVDSLTEAIEAKTTKIGDLGVEIVTLKDDGDDTAEALTEDKAFLQELEKGCGTKAAEWEERKKTRSAELLALAETIKILNDDDALELFKKTLPAPGVGLMQVRVSSRDMRDRAVSGLRRARQTGNRQDRTKLDLIMLSLSGRKVSFAKVITMIDSMVAMLKEEQLADEHKKEYCELQFDEADDKKKELEHTMEVLTNEEQKATAAIEKLTEEIAALVAGIKALDESVASATAQRKAENQEYKDLIASDSAAKELLEIAKNRLNKFYNPSLYNPPAKTELSAESRIVVDMGNPDGIVTTTQPGGIANTGVSLSFAQVAARARARDDVAPAPPPETWDAYAKKGQESTGVVAMIDLLVKDLTLEMTEAKTEEKEAQSEYETLMADSAQKRADDSKTLADKESVKAQTEVDLQGYKASKLSAFKQHQATMQYIASLHAECDWLTQFFDVRKEARNGEIKSLTDAKAVLSGADYSL